VFVFVQFIFLWFSILLCASVRPSGAIDWHVVGHERQWKPWSILYLVTGTVDLIASFITFILQLLIKISSHDIKLECFRTETTVEVLLYRNWSLSLNHHLVAAVHVWVTYSRKRKAPSFQIGSGWNLAVSIYNDVTGWMVCRMLSWVFIQPEMEQYY